MQILYIMALVITAFLSTGAIFSRQFGDNTLQRIGLSAIAFASTVDLIILLDVGNSCCQATNVKTLFIIGAAIYALWAYIKVHKHGNSPLTQEHYHGLNRRKTER